MLSEKVFYPNSSCISISQMMSIYSYPAEKIPAMAKLIFSYIASYIEEYGKDPSSAKIISDLGINKSTFYKYQNILVEEGLLSVKQKKAENQTFLGNEYSLSYPSKKNNVRPFPKFSETVIPETEKPETGSSEITAPFTVFSDTAASDDMSCNSSNFNVLPTVIPPLYNIATSNKDIFNKNIKTTTTTNLEVVVVDLINKYPSFKGEILKIKEITDREYSTDCSEMEFKYLCLKYILTIDKSSIRNIDAWLLGFVKKSKPYAKESEIENWLSSGTTKEVSRVEYYREKQAQNEKERERRLREIQTLFPAYESIETAIKSLYPSLFAAKFSGDRTKAAEIKSEIDEKQRLMDAEFEKIGFEREYLDVYTCPKCKDTGDADGISCDCWEKTNFIKKDL